ncbi:MAG: Cytoplasmic thioredoxin isoenzyme 2 [Alectoria sarmentosa]|nr:MAG: Cytoplasmic thioredoxin isoenzyme 2 [Alectoria sarmentosa]
MQSTEKGVHNLTTKADFDTALAEPSLMIIDCMATWCGPCKVVAPEIVKMSNSHPSARFYKLDVDEVPDVAQELGVRAMPTFLVFRNGEKVGEVVGANPKSLEVIVEREIAAAA